MAVKAEDVAAIGRMFRAVDVIDEHIAARRMKLPARGVVKCPNCPGSIAFVQLTEIKGAARCSTAGCVDFAPLWRVDA